MRRVILDAHGPNGEDGHFWAFLVVENRLTLLCGELPCIVDVNYQDPPTVLLANFDAINSPGIKGKNHSDDNWVSQVVLRTESELSVITFNVGKKYPYSESNQIFGVKRFTPAPEDRAVLLGREPSKEVASPPPGQP